MKRIINLSVILLTFSSLANPAYITKQDYVERWNRVAIQEMEAFGIPASITLAQGILESANGNSDLAVKGNNHFGIK